MRDQYTDRQGRTQPPAEGAMYLGNLRVGRVFRWDASDRVAKVVSQNFGSTSVVTSSSLKSMTRRASRGRHKGEFLDADVHTFTRGAIVRDARNGR